MKTVLTFALWLYVMFMTAFLCNTAFACEQKPDGPRVRCFVPNVQPLSKQEQIEQLRAAIDRRMDEIIELRIKLQKLEQSKD
jgi:hypothetical protein